MTRNMKKALVEHLEQYYQEFSIEEYDYSIAAFDCNEQLLSFIVKHIEDKFEGYKVQVQPIAINVCAHCGPGTIGILLTPKINNKSIYEYLK